MQIQPIQVSGACAIAGDAPASVPKKYKKTVQVVTAVQVITIQRLAMKSIAENRKVFNATNGTKTGGIIEDIESWLSAKGSPEYDSDPENEFQSEASKAYKIEDLKEDPGHVDYVIMKPYAGEQKEPRPGTIRAFIEYAKKRGFIELKDEG